MAAIGNDAAAYARALVDAGRATRRGPAAGGCGRRRPALGPGQPPLSLSRKPKPSVRHAGSRRPWLSAVSSPSAPWPGCPRPWPRPLRARRSPPRRFLLRRQPLKRRRLRLRSRLEEATGVPAPDAEAGPDDLPLAAAGGMLSPQQLIAFRIHDVSPEFIGQIRALGYDRASANELVALRIHDVTPEDIRAMTAVFGKRPLEDYTAFKIHGLTPDAAKALEAVFGKLSSDDALAMRIHGVDASFVQSFRDAGYPPLSADEAVALKIHGVSPEDAAAWKSLGFAAPSVDDLLALRIHGVTPELVRSLRALGFSDLSIDDAVAFRIHGVTPEFVKEIRALGYTAIDADELTAFRIHGVTPEYIRRMNGKLGGTLSPTSCSRSVFTEGRERRMNGTSTARPGLFSGRSSWPCCSCHASLRLLGEERGAVSGRWLLDFENDGSIHLTLKRRSDGRGNWNSWNNSSEYELKDFRGLQRPSGSSDAPGPLRDGPRRRNDHVRRAPRRGRRRTEIHPRAERRVHRRPRTMGYGRPRTPRSCSR